MRGTWIVALTLLMAMIGCGTTEPTSVEPQQADVAAEPVTEQVETGLCPADLADPTGFRPPFPYETTEPDCKAWQERKRECRDAMLAAPSPARDPNQPQRLLSSLHLAAQCQCYEERREALKRCVEMPDCAGFASCTVELSGDGWTPGAG